MSLVSHLRTRNSPVRAWFDRNLGNTKYVVELWNAEFCGIPRRPCLIAPPAGNDRSHASLVGFAVDYLVRAVMHPGALRDTFATVGAHSVPRPAARRLEREAVQVIEELRPWERPPSGQTLIELCRLCLVLARFEQRVRSGLFVGEDYVMPPLLDDPTLTTYAKRVIPPPCVDDLVRLGSIAIEDHIALRDCKQLVLSPRFALSDSLGGAEADLIADGVLWDLKSTANPRSVVKRQEIWQLVGYALADSDDKYAIRTVGISALRRRTRMAQPIDELIAALSGRQGQTLAAWRAEFADATLRFTRPKPEPTPSHSRGGTWRRRSAPPRRPGLRSHAGRVLTALERHPAGRTVDEISELVPIGHTAISGALRVLEDDGFCMSAVECPTIYMATKRGTRWKPAQHPPGRRTEAGRILGALLARPDGYTIEQLRELPVLDDIDLVAGLAGLTDSGFCISGTKRSRVYVAA